MNVDEKIILATVNRSVRALRLGRLIHEISQKLHEINDEIKNKSRVLESKKKHFYMDTDIISELKNEIDDLNRAKEKYQSKKEQYDEELKSLYEEKHEI
jgi:chromosome segregation protein